MSVFDLIIQKKEAVKLENVFLNATNKKAISQLIKEHSYLPELQKYGLLMEGEVAIQQEGKEAPYVYRGFQMVNEEKLRDMRGDELRKINQNGMLPLIHAHLFSLQLVRDIFALQVQQGKVPVADGAATA